MRQAVCALQPQTPTHNAFVGTHIPPATGIRVRHVAKRQCRQVTCQSHYSGNDNTNSSSSSSSFPDALPVVGVDTDWRSFRAKLVTSTTSPSAPSNSSNFTSDIEQCWAHPVPRPEAGCLLLANPIMFKGSQQYFYQSVILIVQHSEEYTMGVILNKPTSNKIGELTGASTFLGPDFSNNYIHLGGDCEPTSLIMLHDVPNLPNSLQVIPGLYMGGMDAAKTAVEQGRARPERFRFYNQYAGWGAGQLEEECRRGVWYTAAASHPVVLQPVVQGMENNMWLAVMQMLGSDYALMAQAAVETYNAAIMDHISSGAVNKKPTSSGGVSDVEEKSDEGGDNVGRCQQQQQQSLWSDSVHDEMGGSGI